MTTRNITKMSRSENTDKISLLNSSDSRDRVPHRKRRHQHNTKNSILNTVVQRSSIQRCLVTHKLALLACVSVLCNSRIAVLGSTSSDGGDSSDRSLLTRSLSSIPTPSPEDSFLEQPANTSVVMGQVAVMKCKASRPVNHCRWYYIELSANFYDKAAEPKLVKDFKPSNDIDCSIRFTKVRKVQEGQWLCQARRYMSTTFYNTRPAVLEVITDSDEREYEERNKQQDDSDEENNNTWPPISRPAPHLPTPTGPSNNNLPRRPGGRQTPNARPRPRHEGSFPSRQPRPRDPTAPTAIPALGPPPSLMPPLSGGERLPTEHRRGPVTPHSHPNFGGPSIPRTIGGDQRSPVFAYSADDHIQNTKTGATATLPCQVNVPVASCSWIMPNNALFIWNDADSSVGRSLSINTPVAPPGQEETKEYEFVGDRATGNCSLKVHTVRHHDEGNWRCIVSVSRLPEPPTHPALAPSVASASVLKVRGPLLHLHLMDFHHNQHGIPQPSITTGTNITLIILFMVGLILFVVGTIIIYCCYKKVWSKPEETNKILQQSPRSSNSEYTQQWFQGRNLKIVDPNYTDDFKLRTVNGEYSVRKVETPNLKNSHVQYSDIDHYNEYLKMTHGSVRSSASSNTTLSTVVPDPLGRDRSVSFGTTPSISPVNMTTRMSHPSHLISHNGNIIAHSPPPGEMDNVSFYEIHRELQRPVSLYSTGHVYEEIQEKIPYNPSIYPPPHIVNGQTIVMSAQGIPVGPIASTPVYTNVVEDHDGYLIPNKSAKIVNTPTGDVDPSQYLAMSGHVLPGPNTKKILNEAEYQPQNVHIHNMNNLSMRQTPTTHMQIVATQNNAPTPTLLDQKRRHSNDSQLSIEQNFAIDKLQKSTSKSSVINDDRLQKNPNLNTSTPTKHGNHKTPTNTPTKQRTHKTPPSTTPNSNKRQKMPLPSQPITLKSQGQSSQQPKFPLNQHISSPNLSLIVHQRTTSLPDTSSILTAATHSKSPSLVPTPENYDVPRSLGEVPRTVNGSEISLDDIDGTIV